jgi:hypothetical protein
LPENRAENKEGNEGNESWLSMFETPEPENEPLLPGESQRDRYIRVQKQKGIETEVT